MTVDASTAWVAVAVVGLGTFLLRLSFVGLGGRLRLPQGVVRALRFLPAAILAAIIVPAVFRTDAGDVVVTVGSPRVLAALVAALVAWRTRHILATIVTGMAVLWLAQLVW